MARPPKTDLKQLDSLDEYSKLDKKQKKEMRNGDEIMLEITDSYIRDENGNIEHHNADTIHRDCTYVAGDYLPGHPCCDAPCPVRSLCVNNALANKRIELDPDFVDNMQHEAATKFPIEYEKILLKRKAIEKSSCSSPLLIPKKAAICAVKNNKDTKQ